MWKNRQRTIALNDTLNTMHIIIYLITINTPYNWPAFLAASCLSIDTCLYTN